MNPKVSKVFKTAVWAILVSMYFYQPSVYTKFPPVVWNALSCNRDHYGLIISVGRLLGAVGDITIDVNFIVGLLFFLLNHLVDIYAFRMSNPKLSIPCIIFGCLYFAFMLYALLPAVPVELVAPVVVYAIALIYSACVATMRYLSGEGISLQSKVFGFVGAWVFVISDTLLAFKIFRDPGRGGSPIGVGDLVMITYYIAQLFIALSSYADTSAVLTDNADTLTGTCVTADGSSRVPLLVAEEDVEGSARREATPLGTILLHGRPVSHV